MARRRHEVKGARDCEGWRTEFAGYRPEEPFAVVSSSIYDASVLCLRTWYKLIPYRLIRYLNDRASAEGKIERISPWEYRVRTIYIYTGKESHFAA